MRKNIFLGLLVGLTFSDHISARPIHYCHRDDRIMYTCFLGPQSGNELTIARDLTANKDQGPVQFLLTLPNVLQPIVVSESDFKVRDLGSCNQEITLGPRIAHLAPRVLSCTNDDY